LNKQHLPYFAAILLAVLIIAPCIAAAADGTYTGVTASEAKQLIEKGDVFILDVRTPDEFNAGHIEGATMIPLASLKNPAGEPKLPAEDLLAYYIEKEIGLPTDKGKNILVYCKTGSRSITASNMLVTADYTNVHNMNGGIESWIDAGYPIVITFVNNLDCIDHSTKTALNAKLNNVLKHLEKGDDLKAIEKIDNFVEFVGEMLTEDRLDSDEAAYLIHESSVHLEDLI
jgi:rhodanese-related sulfurtransferase